MLAVVGTALRLTTEESEHLHEAVQWRYAIVQTLTDHVSDPDKVYGPVGGGRSPPFGHPTSDRARRMVPIARSRSIDDRG